MIGIGAILLLVIAIGALASAIGLALAGYSSPAGVDAWARSNGVALSPTTAPVVDVYLRNRRGLRRAGALAGVLLPPAVTAATGLDLQVSGLVWMLLGYLVGQLVAELSFGRRATSSTRAASLSPRRLVDYLPRPLAVAQVALPAVCVLLGIVVARVTGDVPDVVPLDPGATDPTSGALVAAPVAIVLATAAILGERRLVRRPQPIVDAELVELDDAMRSSAVRVVAATNVAIATLLITTQLGALAYHVDPGLVQGLLWIAMAGVLFVALLSWQRRVHRGWRVSRPGLRAARSEVPA